MKNFLVECKMNHKKQLTTTKHQTFSCYAPETRMGVYGTGDNNDKITHVFVSLSLRKNGIRTKKKIQQVSRSRPPKLVLLTFFYLYDTFYYFFDKEHVGKHIFRT